MSTNVTYSNLTQTSVQITANSNYYGAHYFVFTCAGQTISYDSSMQQSGSPGYYWDYENFYGLSAGTAYICNVSVYMSNGGAFVESGSVSFTTQQPTIQPPSGTTSISATPQSGHSMYVAWNTISGATGYYVYKSDDGGVNYTPYSSVADAGNVTAVNVNVPYEWQNYSFQVTPYNSAGNGPNNYSGTYKSLDETAPSITTFYATQIQQAQITVYISGNDNNPSSGTPSGLYRFRMYRGGSLVGYANINGGANNASQSAYYTYTGLVAKTQYTLEAIAEDNSGNLSSSGSWVIYPTTIDNRPNNWSWYTTKTSGANFDLTASEWNAFTTRINQFQTYKTITNTIVFTSAPYSDGQFYAFMFNQARDAIAAMSPSISPPSSQSSGNIIYASLLDGLRDSLNSIA